MFSFFRSAPFMFRRSRFQASSHQVDEICVLLRNYAAYSGNSLRFGTIYHSFCLRANSCSWGPIDRTETSIKNCYYKLRNFPEKCKTQEIFNISFSSSKERSTEEKLDAKNVNIDEIAGSGTITNDLTLYSFSSLYIL